MTTDLIMRNKQQQQEQQQQRSYRTVGWLVDTTISPHFSFFRFFYAAVPRYHRNSLFFGPVANWVRHFTSKGAERTGEAARAGPRTASPDTSSLGGETCMGTSRSPEALRLLEGGCFAVAVGHSRKTHQYLLEQYATTAVYTFSVVSPALL